MSIPIRVEFSAPTKSRQRDWFQRDLECIQVLFPEAILDDARSNSVAIFLDTQEQAEQLVSIFGGTMMWGIKFFHLDYKDFYEKTAQIEAFITQHQRSDRSLFYRVWNMGGSSGAGAGHKVFYLNDPKLVMLLKLSIA